MIWFIIAVVVAIVVGIAVTIDMGDIFDFFAGGFVGLLCAGFVALVINVIVAAAIDGNSTITKSSQDLVSVRTAVTTEGEFYLGFGNVDDEAVYRFYVLNSNGSYSMRTLEADRVTIFESDGSPRVDYYDSAPTHFWWSVINMESDRYEIHVPKGSIVPTVDLALPS